MANFEIGIRYRASQLRPDLQGIRRESQAAGKSLDALAGRATRAIRQVNAANTRITQAVKRSTTAATGAQRAQTQATRTLQKTTASVETQRGAMDRLTRSQRSSTKATQSWTQGLGRAARVLVLVTAGLFSVQAGISQLGRGLGVFTEFESRMSAVEAVTSASSAAMDRLTGLAKTLGETTVFAAGEAARSMEAFGRAGFTTAQTLFAVPAALDLAAASAIGMGDAARITANLLRSFNKEASESRNVVDLLAAAASSANQTVLSLGEQFKFVAPVASALNQGIVETSAALSVLANQGLGDVAGTGLRRIFSGLAKPVGEAKAAILSMGLTLEALDPTANSIIDIVGRLADANITAAEAFTLFGQRGGPAILALTSQVDALEDLNRTLSDTEGTALRMAETMRDNVRGDFTILQSVLDSLRISFGEAFAPELREQIQRLTTFFGENRAAAVRLGEAMGKVATAVTTAFIAIANTANIWLLLIGAFLATKLLLWLGALGVSLTKRVIEWGQYSAATATATTANTANAASSGRLTAAAAMQGRVLRTVTATTAGAAATTGVATAATWSFAGAVRGLGAAIAANPIGLIVIGLTVLTATLVSAFGAVSEVRAETASYHEELRTGRPAIDAASAAHDRYADTLERELKAAFGLGSEQGRLKQEIAALTPIAEAMVLALDVGDDTAYLLLARAAKALGVEINRFGDGATGLQSVNDELELLEAQLKAAEARALVTSGTIADAQKSLADIAVESLDLLLGRLQEQKAVIAETRVDALKAGAALQEAVATPIGEESGLALERLTEKLALLRAEAELAQDGLARIKTEILALADGVGTALSDLFQAGDIAGAEDLIDRLPKKLFAEIFPEQTKREVLEFQRAIQAVGETFATDFADGQRKAEEATAKLSRKVKEQTERFDLLTKSLAEQQVALTKQSGAALKGRKASSEAERAAKVEQQFRAESSRLTELHSDKLAQLREAIAGVVEQEQFLAGAKVIGRLTEQQEALTGLVAAYRESQAAGERAQEKLDSEADSRKAAAEGIAGQRDSIEALTTSVRALQQVLDTLDRVESLEAETAALERLTAAQKTGSAEFAAVKTQLTDEEQLRRLLAGATFDQAAATVIAFEARSRAQREFDEQAFLKPLQDENAALAVEAKLLKISTALQKQFGKSSREAAVELAIQRELLLAGAEAGSMFADEIREAVEANFRLRDGLRESQEATTSLGDRWIEAGQVIDNVLDGIGEGIGNVIGSLANFAEALQNVGAEGGTAGAFAAGAGAISALAKESGIIKGPRQRGKFGGLGEGDFSAEGKAIGTVIGAIVGSFIPGIGTVLGAALGGILGEIAGSFIKKGAQEALATVKVVGDQLSTQITKAEGPLGKVIGELGASIIKQLNAVGDALGVEILSQPFDLKIRDEEIFVFINGVRGQFEEMGDAIQFAVFQALKTADFTGDVGENTRKILESGKFESFDDLNRQLVLGQQLDRGTAVAREAADAIAEITRLRKEETRIARETGIAISGVLGLANERIDLLRGEIEATLGSFVGISNATQGLVGFKDAVKDFNAGVQEEVQQRRDRLAQLREGLPLLRTTKEFQGEIQAAQSGAAQAQANAVAAAGRLADTAFGLGNRFGNLDKQIADTEDEIRALEASLADLPQAIDVDKIRQAFEAGGAQSGLQIIDLIRQIRGEEFGAAEERRFQTQLFTLQLITAREALLQLIAASDGLFDVSAGFLDSINRTIRGLTSGRLAPSDEGKSGFLEQFAELRRIARGGSKEFGDFTRAFNDFLDSLKEARRTGIRKRDIQGALRDFTTVAAQEIAASFQVAFDEIRGISSFGRQLLEIGERFDDARSRVGLMISALADAGQSTAELGQLMRDLEIAQGLAVRQLGTQFLGALESLGVALPTRLVLQLAEAEFVLAKQRALTSALALAEAGAFEGLGISLGELLDLIKGSEFDPTDVLGFKDTDELFASFGDGTAQSIQDVRDRFEDLRESAASLGATYEMLDDLQLREAAAIEALGISFLESLEKLGVALPVEVIEEIARAEFELAKVRAVNSALALAEAGAFGALSISLDELLGLIFGAEFETAGIGGESPFASLAELFASIEETTEIGALVEQFAELRSQAERLGASEAELASLRAIERDRIFGIVDGVSGVVPALTGFERTLGDIQRTFTEARNALLAGASSAGQLAGDLDALTRAENQAARALGGDFLQSLEQLGVSLPIEVTLELAEAQFVLAQAQAVASALALQAAGAFEGLSITLDELLGLITGVAFDPGTLLDSTDAVRPGRGGGGGGGGPGRDDLAALRQAVEDQIRAWLRLPLGEVTNQAIELIDTLNQLRVDAKAAGVAVSEVNEAFQVALDAFVADALRPFQQLDLSPLEAELQGILDGFVDLLVAFDVAGASSEQLLELQDAFTSAMADFIDRATQGIRDFLRELRAEDPRVSGEQAFTGAQEEFRSLLARAQGGDLEALEQLEGAARTFRDEALDFLGGGVGFQEILDEIIRGLEGVEDFELVPADIALLQEQAIALREIVELTAQQPTVETQEGGFGGVSSGVLEIADAVGIQASALAQILFALEKGVLTVEDIPQVLAILEGLATDVAFLPGNVGGILNALTGVLAVSDDLTAESVDRVLGALGGVLTVADELAADQIDAIIGVIDTLSDIGGLTQDQASALGDMVSALLGIEGLTGDQVGALNDIADALGIPIVVNVDVEVDVPDYLAGFGPDLNTINAGITEVRDDVFDVQQGVQLLGLGIGNLGSEIDSGFAAVLAEFATLPQAHTGALVLREGLVNVQANERILSPDQTRAFEASGGLRALESNTARIRSEPRRRHMARVPAARSRRGSGRGARGQRVEPATVRRSQPSTAVAAGRSAQISAPPEEERAQDVVAPGRAPVQVASPTGREREEQRVEELDQRPVVDGLLGVEDAVTMAAKDENRQAAEAMKLQVLQANQGLEMVQSLGVLESHLEALREELTESRIAVPAGRSE